jgi:hypothetical protein
LALDDLVKTAAKKKDEAKTKKEKKEEEKAKKEKEEKAKAKKEDKNDAKGMPPWLKKKDEKKDSKKEDKKDDKKKVKKASEDCGDIDVDCGDADCGDMAMAEDTDDNREFEELMSELESPDGENDWNVLENPEEGKGDLDIDDPELESLVEGLEDNAVTEEPDLDEFTRSVASKKTSLQKLADFLAKR